LEALRDDTSPVKAHIEEMAVITAEVQGLRRQDGVPNPMLQKGYLPKPTHGWLCLWL